MEFVYKGLSSEGKRISGTLDVASLDEAKRQLRSQGIIYSSLQHKVQWELFKIFGVREIPSSLLIRISRDLSVYLRAGVP
jgi:type II secretory pathway component PulF